MRTYINGKITLHPENSIKLCMPFLDSLTSGYCVTLAMDLIVEGPADNKFIEWRGENNIPLSMRTGTENKAFPIPAGFSKQHFVWTTPLALGIDAKYSILVTHPFNRFDLPFITLTGIVDGGFDLTSGSVPFFISNDFEGVIPQGTPIAQVLPFKRENWKSELKPGLYQSSLVNKKRSESVISGWYKNTFWRKKTYN